MTELEKRKEEATRQLVIEKLTELQGNPEYQARTKKGNRISMLALALDFSEATTRKYIKQFDIEL